MAACLSHKWKSVVSLISRGANVLLQDCNGDTALHYIARLKNVPEIARSMMRVSPMSIEMRNNAGETPMDVALKCESTRMVAAMNAMRLKLDHSRSGPPAIPGANALLEDRWRRLLRGEDVADNDGKSAFELFDCLGHISRQLRVAENRLRLLEHIEEIDMRFLNMCRARMDHILTTATALRRSPEKNRDDLDKTAVRLFITASILLLYVRRAVLFKKRDDAVPWTNARYFQWGS